MLEEIIKVLKSYQLPLEDEKETQAAIGEAFQENQIPASPEFRLDNRSIIDFYCSEKRIGIEVKLKGSTTKIFSQCERYCQFDAIDCLILLTRKTMGMPEKINGKRVIVISLGEAWL